MSATKNSHDWHCEEHGTYGWRGESCRQCPEAPSKIKSIRAQIAELKAENERLKGLNVELTDRCNWYNCDGARLERQRDEYKADAEKWRAYAKRKADVIAAGMGRKILRDLERRDALPDFYNEPKKGEFVVRCVMCGKDFRVGDKAECGGLFSGKPMCKTGDIQRELDSRLPEQREEV